MAHRDEKVNGTAGVVVKASAVPTGEVYLPDKWVLAGADHAKDSLYPDYSFFIQHPSGKTLMFDLGMRKDLESYPPRIQAEFPATKPSVRKSAGELLSEVGFDPKSLDFVVYSHLHFDHIGDPSEFPNSQVVCGPGSKEVAYPGYPTIPDSPFLGSILEHPNVRELSYDSAQWTSFGPFPKAYDFFDDGSFLLLDAPGHMPGHMMGLARTAADEYIVMGGDCCHHRKIFTGEAQIGEGFGPSGAYSMHKDLPTAKSTISKLHEVSLRDDVLVCLAHDAFLEPHIKLLPSTLNGWRKAGLKAHIKST